jgi:hypothetical protein
VDNHGPGIDATSGLTLVQGSGFENNQGTGAIVQGSATFNGDTFSTYGPEMTGVGGYLAVGQVTVIGDFAEYYGPASATLELATRNACHRRQRRSCGGAGGGRDRWCRRPHDGDRSARIDQPGSGLEPLFSVPGRRIVGPALSYGGAPVTAGEFGSWTRIGAEKDRDRL